MLFRSGPGPPFNSAQACPPPPTQPPAAEEDDSAFGPPPPLLPALRITEGLLPTYQKQLLQPAVQNQLGAVADLASSDPEAAAMLLQATLYDAAAAVFPEASSRTRQEQRHSGRQHWMRKLPWFDRECELARLHLRQTMAANPNSHLAQEAVRVLCSKYRRLLDGKNAAWRRQRSKALLHLHHSNARAFFKKWKTKAASNPISAAAWLRHFVHLQRTRKFKPSQAAQPAAAAAVATTPQPSVSVAPGNPPPTEHSTPDAPPPTQDAPGLDQNWTADDVIQACKKLSSTSACLGPLKAVLIKAGGGSLAPVLAKLFTAVFSSGRVPREWLLGAITAIHKKGDVGEPNNYRGITVGHVLGKLYALMLNLRLTAWAEDSGKRARGQGGFRQGFRTIDNCFILRALVERARAKGVKLYVCAVDLEKAFDCVDRNLLWAALQRAGIGGCMLAALQALYADVPVCVKTAEGLSNTFQSTIGVKQGCPLSPLLFGMFLDDFEMHMQSKVPPTLAQLPLLGGCIVPPLLFADDMLLISTSVAGLNAQLRSLQAYCDAKKLTVNAAKTQVVILRPGGGGGGRLAAGEAFFYAGQPLEVVKTIKYLGLTFAQLSKAHGFACCAETLAGAGRRALFAMRRRAWEMGAGAVEHQLRLFDIFVQPVLSYGCEIWGVDLLDQPASAPERVQRWFCRRLLGLSQGASSAVALAELGRWPLQLRWGQQLVRYWNRLLELQGSGRLISCAFQDNIALMQEQLALKVRTGREVPSPCWSLRWLRSLASTAPTDTGTLLGVTELDEKLVMERARVEFVRAAAGSINLGTEIGAANSPRLLVQRSLSGAGIQEGGPTVPISTPPTGMGAAEGRVLGQEQQGDEGVYPGLGPSGSASRRDIPPPIVKAPSKFAVYQECVRGDTPLGSLAAHLKLGAVHDWRHRIGLSRFRCSSHGLRVESDRYLPVAIKPPRHLRTCLLCARNLVENEHHLVFDCPLYDGQRFEFADLFSTDCRTLPCFLNQPNQDRVAHFIYACLDLRRSATQ